jgi:CheY-like chemotaxis protein
MNDTLKGKTVLIADDDQDILDQQKLVLGNEGYNVVTCSSRKEAEEYIAGAAPDIMIVDLMMETNDAGFVLCYHLKKKYPDVPVIVVTSVAGDTGIEFDAMTSEERSWIKADVLLNKPVRSEQLIREIERLLHRKA